MRVAIATFLVAAACVGPAFADEISDPVWAKGPGLSDWAKAYPAHAARAHISGEVRLRCEATASGALTGCAVISETPTSEGFGAAALALATGMELRPTTADGRPIAGRSLVVPIKFAPDVLAGSHVITNPDWLRQPTNNEALSYYPAAADGLAGQTIVHCTVTVSGVLDDCVLKEEEPKGHGFGAASLAMTGLFLMRPMTLDGQPQGGGEVNIPVLYEASGFREEPVRKVGVLANPAWIAAPTAAEVLAAYPARAKAWASAGHVVLRCALAPSGKLEDCSPISEAPAGRGFADAAVALSRKFQVSMTPQLAAAARWSDERVDVPFEMRNPSQPQAPLEIYSANWLRAPDVGDFFPEAAKLSSLKTGRAVLACTVAHDGSLTGCQVASEDPAGFGFGAAALRFAAGLQMSPWSQGAPVEGAQIRVPIRLNAPELSAPPPAAGASASK